MVFKTLSAPSINATPSSRSHCSQLSANKKTAHSHPFVQILAVHGTLYSNKKQTHKCFKSKASAFFGNGLLKKTLIMTLENVCIDSNEWARCLQMVLNCWKFASYANMPHNSNRFPECYACFAVRWLKLQYCAIPRRDSINEWNLA